MKPKVIVIVGPTASGKTSLSIELAKKINGEIVSCDSMQIYKDMDIGSAKPTKEEMQGIKHYLLDFVSPDERYSVADYKRDAKKAIKEIIAKGKTPIIVGGTGLYVDSLIYEIEYQDIEFDEMRIKVDHQLQRTSQMKYVIEQPKTESGIRYVPMTDEVASCFRRIIANRVAPRTEPMIDGYIGFLFLDASLGKVLDAYC